MPTRVVATYAAVPGTARTDVLAAARAATGAGVWVTDRDSVVDLVVVSSGPQPRYDRPAFGPALQLVDAWVVDEVEQWGGGDLGAEQFSVFAFERRRPEIPPAEFTARYRDGHGPLARVHHPGMARYVQRFVVPEPGRSGTVDVIAELAFRSRSDARDRFYATAESQRIVLADVDAYMDRSSGWSVRACSARYASD